MIPVEMTHFPAFVVWRYEQRDNKPTKVPYSPKTLMRASVTEPLHWGTYGEAAHILASGAGSFDGLGFVLSFNDPYTIIDIDDPLTQKNPGVAIERAKKLLETFDTYTEISPSGNGMHIILRGAFPGEGRRRDGIEMYCRERYFTMTGNPYRDTQINESDYFLQRLWEELGGAKKTAPGLEASTPQTISDEDVYNKACETNDKFLALWQGRYREWYDNQSSADQALINIICFYSRNADQVARMFHYSELGKRPKAHRHDYLKRTIEKSFDNLTPDISLDQLMGNLAVQIQEQKQAEKLSPKPVFGVGWTLPTGLMGDIARFVYEAAPRPSQEIALAAAIGLMAGICGRSYNVSSTGLNQYILLLATTGRGKEAMKSGITKLMKRVSSTLAGAGDFIGPSDIASGQALVKYIGQNPCFVSIMGEFGQTFQLMCAQNAAAAEVTKRKVILDLYGKSGKTDSLHQTIYSDKNNNTNVVQSPAFTILAETTPDSFFPYLTEDIVAMGLLPRFTCIEYRGTRVANNKHHANAKPTDDLIESITTLCANALTLQSRNEVIEVKVGVQAQEYVDGFDIDCDKKINNSDNEVARQLWTRAHLKLLKLAALIAVGVDPFEPCITLDIAQWACNMVCKDIANILDRFESGTVGKDSAEQNQIRRLLELIKDYITRPFDGTLEKYQVNEAMHRDRAIQYMYLSKHVLKDTRFKQDRMGASFALRRSLEQLVTDGTLAKVSSHQVETRYNTRGDVYFIADLKRLA